MFKILRGINVPPTFTGFARGAVEAGLMAAVVAVVAAATGSDAPATLQLWAPVIIIGGRTLEGAIDHIDPSKKRAPGP